MCQGWGSSSLQMERRRRRCEPTKARRSATSFMQRMQLFTLLLILLLQMVTAAPTSSSHHDELLLQAEREELAKQWAPLVWLHSNEHFYPSSVFNFLQHVKPSKPGRGNLLAVSNGDSEIIFPSLPNGRSSWDTYLLASINTECHNCHLPKFLYGKKPGRNYSPPTYGVIHSCITTREQKRGPQNPYTSRQEFLNDDANTQYTSSFDNDFSSKHDSPSLLSPNTSSYETKMLPNTSFPPVPTQSSHSTIKPSHSTTQPSHSTTQPSHSTTNINNINMNTNLTSTNDSLTASLPNSKNNSANPETLKVNSNLLLLTTIASKSKHVENMADISSKSLYNITDESETLDGTLIQNDQASIIKQNTILDISEENIYRSPIKDQKRNVIYDSNHQFSITYWMFYPYNYGKDTCTGNLGYFGRIIKPTIKGVCHGEKVAMGNHIGDWEHITIQFKGRTPTKLYISSHNFGAYYTYDPHNHVFHYTSQDNRKGIALSPQYHPFLQLQDNHPIVFSALGSHGLWPTQGTHQYNSFPLLEDQTGKGTQWHTWENLEIMDLKYSQNLNPFQRHWMSYEGRWGNPSNNCHTLMGGFCEMNDGPTGIPRKRINFPCSS